MNDFETRLFEYLSDQLTNFDTFAFERTGPHSLFFKNEVDTILVYVANHQFVIITDGEHTVSELTILPLQRFKVQHFETESELHDFCNREFLQVILNKF